jgi:hypothetical protein
VSAALCAGSVSTTDMEILMARTPNDDRSDSMNPNNDAYWDSLDNHSDQLNPNNERYQGDDEVPAEK